MCGAPKVNRKRGPLSPRSGKQVRRALGVSARSVREALVSLRAIALQEEVAGLDPRSGDWEFMSALLADSVARLTVGGGANPKLRLKRRGVEILIEATKETRCTDLDRKTAMYLVGMLLGLLPLGRGRSVSGLTELEKSLGLKAAARREIIEGALGLLHKDTKPPLALWTALCEHGEHPKDMPLGEFTNLLKRLSDARRGRSKPRSRQGR